MTGLRLATTAAFVLAFAAPAGAQVVPTVTVELSSYSYAPRPLQGPLSHFGHKLMGMSTQILVQ